MTFVEELLIKIDDEKPLGEHLGNEAFKALYDAYQALAANDDNLPLISDKITCWAFKQSLEKMSAPEKISLFHDYLRATSIKFEEEENPVQANWKRNIKGFYMKLTGVVLAIAVIATVGAGVGIAWRSGKVPSSELIESYFSLAADMAEVVLSHKKD